MKTEKQKSDNHLFLMVAGLILAHREKNINDIDLYNSILRLISGAHDKKHIEEMEEVVRWLEREEKNGTDPQAQYLKENVMENAGENYFEGLETIVIPISHYEGIIKKHDTK